VGSGPPPSAAGRRAQLADFLKARRAALRPEDAGLTPGGRRRTPGLRREEVADLAGVGLSWYTWLEQGRDITPSAQVLDALSRALRLTPAGREHLFALAGTSVPAGPSGSGGVDAGTAAMVTALAPHPAYLLDDRFDVLAHNAAAEFVLGDLLTAPPERRNLLLWLFHGRDTWTDDLQESWVRTARANLLDFRIAHATHTADPAFGRLVEQLRASSGLFRRWWAEHDVAALEPTRKTLRHPEAGELRLLQIQTRIGERALRLRILVPADDATRTLLADRFGRPRM
jgi:transcriptional regulator with XRE-family HTH domain